MNLENEKTGIAAIALVSMIGIAGVLMLDPVAQDIDYHLFKDQRTILSIPNFWNVITNLPFLLVGVIGLHSIHGSHPIRFIAEMKVAYTLLFAGVSLIAFGSSYYHLWPSNGSLVWDRLPMAIVFMALLSVVIGEFVSVQLGRLALWPLIIFGVFSVIYWQFTEDRGEGDLRLYVLVQFLPMMVIPLILLCFKSTFNCTSGYWLLLCAYGLAKAFEYFDEVIYNMPFLLSGHSFKHIIAAFGLLFLLKAYKNRELT